MWPLACYSFHGRGLTPRTMVGHGRAAIPQLGVGRGRTLSPSFTPGPVHFLAPAPEEQAALQSQTSLTGRQSEKQINLINHATQQDIKCFLFPSFIPKMFYFSVFLMEVIWCLFTWKLMWEGLKMLDVKMQMMCRDHGSNAHQSRSAGAFYCGTSKGGVENGGCPVGMLNYA